MPRAATGAITAAFLRAQDPHMAPLASRIARAFPGLATAAATRFAPSSSASSPRPGLVPRLRSARSFSGARASPVSGAVSGSSTSEEGQQLQSELIFLGTGTSEGIPRVSCLTHPTKICPRKKKATAAAAAASSKRERERERERERNKEADEVTVELRAVGFGKEVVLKQWRRMRRRRRLGEEERAAILLMALSSGVVYA